MKSLNEYLAYYDPMRESNAICRRIRKRSGTPGYL